MANITMISVIFVIFMTLFLFELWAYFGPDVNNVQKIPENQQKLQTQPQPQPQTQTQLKRNLVNLTNQQKPNPQNRTNLPMFSNDLNRTVLRTRSPKRNASYHTRQRAHQTRTISHTLGYNDSFAQEFEHIPRTHPIGIPSTLLNTLRCGGETNCADFFNISNHINVTMTNIQDFGFKPTTICIYDFRNTCHTRHHLSVASNATHVCTFRMQNLYITGKGALMEDDERMRGISFGHPTMVGGTGKDYAPIINYAYLKGFDNAVGRYHSHLQAKLPPDAILIPVRSRWDDCFNHQSFQIIPAVSLIYEFHREDFYRFYWHASKYTAALLLLADIPARQIIIEKDVKPSNILLTWIPYWNPMQLSGIYGIAKDLEAKMTANLLKMNFTQLRVPEIPVLDYKFEKLNLNFSQLEQGNKNNSLRFIVYLQRNHSDAHRNVANERELMSLLQKAIDPTKVQIIVLLPTKPYHQAEQMHMIWQQYARILHRAKVLIGPHGKWTTGCVIHYYL
jgi:hypothetical protein